MPNRVHLTVPPDFRRTSASFELHRSGLPQEEVQLYEGVPVTTPARSIVDAASDGSGPEQIEKAVQQAVARGLASPEKIEAVAMRGAAIAPAAPSCRSSVLWSERGRTPSGFREQLLARLRNEARQQGVSAQRLQQRVAFDRLLARLRESGDWVLKGGFALELRYGWQSCPMLDIDLRTSLERRIARYRLWGVQSAMPKLPRVTGAEAQRACESDGWRVVRQRGSHVLLRHPQKPGLIPIPLHAGKILKPGTLTDIIARSGMSIDQFVAKL
ncbi:MAG: type II toxin-antitoxin system HicA family toxin [Dehalococcoidia bacterium]